MVCPSILQRPHVRRSNKSSYHGAVGILKPHDPNFSWSLQPGITVAKSCAESVWVEDYKTLEAVTTPKAELHTVAAENLGNMTRSIP